MESNKKIVVSIEVADFIKSHNAIYNSSQKYNTSIAVYWNECKYIETEDPNIFEVIFPNDLISEFVENRRREIDGKKSNS